MYKLTVTDEELTTLQLAVRLALDLHRDPDGTAHCMKRTDDINRRMMVTDLTDLLKKVGRA